MQLGSTYLLKVFSNQFSFQGICNLEKLRGIEITGSGRQIPALFVLRINARRVPEDPVTFT